jgi:hypothetical protein
MQSVEFHETSLHTTKRSTGSNVLRIRDRICAFLERILQALEYKKTFSWRGLWIICKELNGSCQTTEEQRDGKIMAEKECVTSDTHNNLLQVLCDYVLNTLSPLGIQLKMQDANIFHFSI